MSFIVLDSIRIHPAWRSFQNGWRIANGCRFVARLQGFQIPHFKGRNRNECLGSDCDRPGRLFKTISPSWTTHQLLYSNAPFPQLDVWVSYHPLPVLITPIIQALIKTFARIRQKRYEEAIQTLISLSQKRISPRFSCLIRRRFDEIQRLPNVSDNGWLVYYVMAMSMSPLHEIQQRWTFCVGNSYWRSARARGGGIGAERRYFVIVNVVGAEWL